MAGISKRELLGASLGASLAAGPFARAVAAAPLPAIAPGRFQPTVESLSTYQTPAWFRDAKFGIWAHWGPQAVPRRGDWYARFMYVPGHPHYAHHVATYGHPSEFGYKDIILLWTADKFDPDALMDRYAAAGAKYFVSMGVHHDNFDLWASKHHRWNAVAMGPKRDIVGDWQKAARRNKLRFGVSEHLGASHNWWYPSHLYDQFWPKLGVDYDGADPRFADLYHAKHDEPYTNKPGSWYTNDPAYHALWFARIRDLVDSYGPDLLYSDGGLPFGAVGRSLVAHLYNSSIARHGTLDAVYTCKDQGSGDFYKGACVQDVERGVLAGINPLAWQTDTSNGDWFDNVDDRFKTPPQVIAMLADIVSKNGNMLLNVALHADGSLPPQSQELLAELAAWMAVNAEAIHGTRPWAIFGEGPTEAVAGSFKEDGSYVAQDIRFTTKRGRLYAITLGEPAGATAITALAAGNPHDARRIKRVRLLGHGGTIGFEQTGQALVIARPDRLPTRHASVFEISFA